jgi:hypothetical protein
MHQRTLMSSRSHSIAQKIPDHPKSDCGYQTPQHPPTPTHPQDLTKPPSSPELHPVTCSIRWRCCCPCSQPPCSCPTPGLQMAPPQNIVLLSSRQRAVPPPLCLLLNNAVNNRFTLVGCLLAALPVCKNSRLITGRPDIRVQQSKPTSCKKRLGHAMAILSCTHATRQGHIAQKAMLGHTLQQQPTSSLCKGEHSPGQVKGIRNMAQRMSDCQYSAQCRSLVCSLRQLDS